MFRANNESSLMRSHESRPFVARTHVFRLMSTEIYPSRLGVLLLLERLISGLAFSFGARTKNNKLQVYKLSTMKISNVGLRDVNLT